MRIKYYQQLKLGVFSFWGLVYAERVFLDLIEVQPWKELQHKPPLLMYPQQQGSHPLQKMTPELVAKNKKTRKHVNKWENKTCELKTKKKKKKW